MLLIPRGYQYEAVDSFYNYFSKHTGNPVCAMPTGTGKSVVIAMFIESVFRIYNNQKILILTHVKELIQQNYEKMMQLWPGAPAGVNSASLGQRDIHQKILFAGIQSVAKQAHLFGHVDLIMIDEAHLLSPKDTSMYQKFIADLTMVNPALKVIGFTATPWRLGQGHICGEGSLFTDVCFDITGMEAFNRLIAEGYLAPLTVKRTQLTLNVDGVGMRGMEFIESELQRAVDKIEITIAALAEAVRMGHDRKKWLIFASGTKHSDNISEIMEDQFGIVCPSVHSKNSGRDEAIKALRNGDVRAVVNNNILTTGVDVEDIDFIVCLRPTGSSALWVQMLGRGTRIAPGKIDCLVGDFAGNTRRLGPVNDPVIPHKKGQKPGKAPIRECDICGTYNHASAKQCSTCGHVWPEKVKIFQHSSTDEVMKGDMPVIEVLKVDHITYTQHQKLGKPPAMKVGYYCGLRLVNEFVCLEHEGYASRKARMWWRDRSTDAIPESTEQLIAQAEGLKVPTHLRVWVNKKPYQEIMAHCYDGTAFGSKQASDSDSDEGPSVQAHPKVQNTLKERIVGDAQDFDDGIPF